MDNIDENRRLLSKEFVAERLFDIRANSVPGIDFWDEIDKTCDASTGNSEGCLLPADPYDFKIKIGDVRVCAHTRRITYVAVVDKVARGKWQIIPFSRYDNPANEKELLSEYAGGGALSVLQIWNFKVYSSAVLGKSWKLPSPLSPSDLWKARRLLCWLKGSNVKLSENIIQKTGFCAPEEEALVSDYEREESENFSEMDKEEEDNGKRTSNMLSFPKWVNYAIAASLVAVIGTSYPVMKPIADEWSRMSKCGDIFEEGRKNVRGGAAHLCFAVGSFCSLSGDVLSCEPEIVFLLPNGTYTVEVKEEGGDFHLRSEYNHASEKKTISWERLLGEKALARGKVYVLSVWDGKKLLLENIFEVISEKHALVISKDLIKEYWKYISRERYDYALAAIYYKHDYYSDAYPILLKLVRENPENEKYRNALNLTEQKLRAQSARSEED